MGVGLLCIQVLTFFAISFSAILSHDFAFLLHLQFWQTTAAGAFWTTRKFTFANSARMSRERRRSL
jgi:hypothetical protein